LLDAAKVAEATIDTSQLSMTELMEAITRLQISVVTPLSTPQQPSSAARRPRSPPPFQRQPSRRHQVNNDQVCSRTLTTRRLRRPFNIRRTTTTIHGMTTATTGKQPITTNKARLYLLWSLS